MKEFGIIVTAFNRPLYLADVLESLKKQEALKYTEVWIDGFQGNQLLKLKTSQTYEVALNYGIKNIKRHNGTLGFRKMMMHVLLHAAKTYKYFVILEDDCFPTKNAIQQFRDELVNIEKKENIFSVYGHYFGVPAEKDTIGRFQGWGWGTTSEKMKPVLNKLIDCYSMTEENFLSFVKEVMTPEVKKRLDITPPRNPSLTLDLFFAWDETLALLTSLENQVHKKTSSRTIYNFGMGKDSTHFEEKHNPVFRNPPFNMISHEEIWKYF